MSHRAPPFPAPIGKGGWKACVLALVLKSRCIHLDRSLKTGSDLVGGNSLTTNLDDAVKLTDPVLSDSPGDVGETVDGGMMDRSPVETISVCVTSVTARGSGSPS